MRIIDDHKPLIEDLSNTGHELMDMCTDEDASDLKEDIENVNTKYEEVKSAIRAKLQNLDEALRNVTSEVCYLCAQALTTSVFVKFFPLLKQNFLQNCW